MGFLADLQREAERERRRREQEERRLVREYEKAQREAERQAAREEKERKQLYVEQRTNEAAKLNDQLHRRVEELEGLLIATLSVDDYIDLDRLKVSFIEPPFDDHGLAVELPPPEPPQIQPPSTLGALVPGAKTKYEAALASAEVEHAQETETWRKLEEERVRALANAREEHEQGIKEKRRETETANAAIDVFEKKLESGEPAAIVDYLGMVLERSRYPDDFPRSHKIAFVPESKQVVIEHDLPDFDAIPEAKESYTQMLWMTPRTKAAYLPG